MDGQLRDAVALLAGAGQVVEVRALADLNTHSGYFNDYEALVRQVEALGTDSTIQGIYITLNEVNPALFSRRANRIKMRLGKKDSSTGDADILRRRWLPIDIDPLRPSGVSSTDEEHTLALNKAEEIARWIAGLGFPEPIRADSGNGAHLLYRIDLPNDESATTLVKACLTTLDTLFSDDRVNVDTANFNAARIWKLYGTVSRKGDSTPERPHRRSCIISAPAELKIVSPEQLPRSHGPAPDRAAGTAAADRSKGQRFRPAPMVIRSRAWGAVRETCTAAARSTLSTSARSHPHIRTGRLRSSSGAERSLRDASTHPAAAVLSGGRISASSSNQTVQRSGNNGTRHRLHSGKKGRR